MFDLADALSVVPAVQAISPLRGEDAFVYDNDHTISPTVSIKLAKGHCRAWAVQDTWAAAVWCDPNIPRWFAFGMTNGRPRGFCSAPTIEDLIERLHDELETPQ